jgi:hypothetical protein
MVGTPACSAARRPPRPPSGWAWPSNPWPWWCGRRTGRVRPRMGCAATSKAGRPGWKPTPGWWHGIGSWPGRGPGGSGRMPTRSSWTRPPSYWPSWAAHLMSWRRGRCGGGTWPRSPPTSARRRTARPRTARPGARTARPAPRTAPVQRTASSRPSGPAGTLPARRTAPSPGGTTPSQRSMLWETRGGCASPAPSHPRPADPHTSASGDRGAELRTTPPSWLTSTTRSTARRSRGSGPGSWPGSPSGSAEPRGAGPAPATASMGSTGVPGPCGGSRWAAGSTARNWGSCAPSGPGRATTPGRPAPGSSS